MLTVQRQLSVSDAVKGKNAIHDSAVTFVYRDVTMQVKHMELEQRVKLARLILALAKDDREAVVAAYTAMGVRTKNMGERHTGKVVGLAHPRSEGGTGNERASGGSSWLWKNCREHNKPVM